MEVHKRKAPVMTGSLGCLRFEDEVVDYIFISNIKRRLYAFQIRMSACSSECVPTSATTPKAPTNAAATSTSPGSTRPARLTVRTRAASALYTARPF